MFCLIFDLCWGELYGESKIHSSRLDSENNWVVICYCKLSTTRRLSKRKGRTVAFGASSLGEIKSGESSKTALRK